ncbi:hypothetical protein [Nocardia asiatica]|uniref:hypothetical protein n=1 Tax=Nocardia asiatica TaxID=209252 RepID=UPI003EE0BB44
MGALDVKTIGLRIGSLAGLIVAADLLMVNDIQRDLALLAAQLTIELLLPAADAATPRPPGASHPGGVASDPSVGGCDE